MMKRRGEQRCAWLFAAIILQYLAQPYLGVFQDWGFPFLSALVPDRFAVLLFSLTLLAAIYTTTEGLKTLVFGGLLLLPTLLAAWGSLFIESPFLITVRAVLLFGVILYANICLLRYIFSGGEVTADRIFGAVDVYFLTGFGFSVLFSLIEYHSPGSFTNLTPGNESSDLFYFSFVALTTVGFGDIAPVTPEARSLAALESVAGVLYTATLIARLVSLYKPSSRA